MNLNNDLISNWIYKRFQKDYFLFDRICSTPRIIHFELIDNSLIVEYEFWDDGHADTDDQEFFIFDLEIGNEYGINYPAKLQLVKIKEKYTWSSLALLHSLSEDIIDSEDLDHDIKFFSWGDKEIESLVDLYFPINTSYGSGVKEMLLEGYNVTELGLPNCIPPRLRNYFQAIVDYEY